MLLSELPTVEFSVGSVSQISYLAGGPYDMV